jgi:hypothetical protein
MGVLILLSVSMTFEKEENEKETLPCGLFSSQNFLKCSLRVMNPGLANQVWDLLMAEVQQQQQQVGLCASS